jgi:AraC-like DNA-binding protein
VRISIAWHLPQVMREFGLDLDEVLEAAGVRPDIFSDRENQIAYTDFARLLLTCEQLSNCDHVVLLFTQHCRLTDFGLAGRAALCGGTAGEGLKRFVDHFNLHSSATTASVITSGSFTRFVYAISERDMTNTRPFHLGAMVAAFNILQDLCGKRWLPTVVTFASRSPTNLRPAQKFFRAPLRFDSAESAIVLDSHWLDRPLPPVDPQVRSQIEAEVRAARAAVLADFPATVRRVLRKQLIVGGYSMDGVAALLGMNRRTLARHLKRNGIDYRELMQSVELDVACQLLRDTDMQVQQIAESLHYSSSANFATAFKRWTGVSPGEYRRRAR